jgi:hypothetical protein
MPETTDARYVLRVIKFDCVDESGFDFLGSDEPFWIFTATDSSGKVHTTRSKVFGDVDSGDTLKFASDNNRNLVWPEKGAKQGAPAPIGLSIQLWDSDQGDPAEVAKTTQLAFDLGGQAPVVGEWVKRVPPIVRDKLVQLVADDLLGSKTLLYPARRLAGQLTSVGARLGEKHRFGGRSGDLPFEVAGGPDYDLHIEITRVAWAVAGASVALKKWSTIQERRKI